MSNKSQSGSISLQNRKLAKALENETHSRRPLSPSLDSKKNFGNGCETSISTRSPNAKNKMNNSMQFDEMQSPTSSSLLNLSTVLSDSKHPRKISDISSIVRQTGSVRMNSIKSTSTSQMVTSPKYDRAYSGLPQSPNVSMSLKSKEGMSYLSDFNASPQAHLKNSSHILGNLSGIKASSMIPLSQTNIVGLSSSHSSFQRQDSAQKSKISRLGLSLKPICSQHKNQQIKFICVDANCSSNERVLCNECVDSFGHSLHEVKTIQEYLLLVESSQEQFTRKYYYLKQMQEQLENPPFLSDISAKINELKKSLCMKLDKIKEDVYLEYKTKLSEDQNKGKQSNNSSSHNGSPERPFQKKQQSISPNRENKNSGLSLQAIHKEIDRMDEIKGFWQDIERKNFFDLTKAEINMSLGMISCKNFISLDKIQELMMQKYQTLSTLFCNSVTAYLNNLSQSFENVIESNKLEIPPPPNSNKSNDQILSELEQNLVQIDNEIKVKRSQMKLITGQIQQHKAALKNKNIQKSPNLFPYNSYATPCAHLIELGLEGNTVPIFECCQQAYQCVECHYQFCKHTPKITNPSKRYCMQCLSVFKVAYPTDLSINCNECIS